LPLLRTIARHGETNTVATNLKPVDVVVVGLGAAGGVAVLSLTRGGLKVVGLEVGAWMNPAKDFKADEIYNNVRGNGRSEMATASLPRCALTSQRSR
jgi:choline dehydrogenase-like flavoprotein